MSPYLCLLSGCTVSSVQLLQVFPPSSGDSYIALWYVRALYGRHIFCCDPSWLSPFLGALTT